MKALKPHIGRKGLPALGFAVVLLLAAWAEGKPPGETAPDFHLVDLAGRTHTLSQYRGRVVLLDFWATWCPPCRASIPELIEIQKKYGVRGLLVLGVSVDSPALADEAYLRRFVEKKGINYPVMRAEPGVVRAYFGGKRPPIPTAVLIDGAGRIRDVILGFRAGAVERSIRKVMGLE